MPRVPTLILPALAVALWPLPSSAQEGPSFSCRYAQTATETAICANPRLAQLEMRMYGAYQRLVEAVGEPRARRIADRFLERRQACGADEDCIAQRLRISMRAFERRADGDTRLATAERGEEAQPDLDEDIIAAAPAPVEEQVASTAPLERVLTPRAREDIAPDPVIAVPDLAPAADTALAEPVLPDPQVASVEPTDPDLPLAAQAPLPPDLAPLLEEDAPEPPPAEEQVATAEPPPVEEQVATAEPPPSDDQLDEAIAGAELASSDQAASFDQPISWAFMDLGRDQRSEIQTRLQAAGYHQGPVEGSWDQATLAALDAFFASEEGQGFDPSTENGAALALDYIRSEAFAGAQGLAPAEAAPEAAPEEPAPDPNDPLTSTEW